MATSDIFSPSGQALSPIAPGSAEILAQGRQPSFLEILTNIQSRTRRPTLADLLAESAPPAQQGGRGGGGFGNVLPRGRANTLIGQFDPGFFDRNAKQGISAGTALELLRLGGGRQSGALSRARRGQ